MIIRVIPESSTAVSELMTGGVDVMTSFAADQIDLLKNADAVNVIDVPGKNLSILSFADCEQNPLFSDMRLRQAVCYALDMDSINAALYGDSAQPALSAIPTCMQAGDREDYAPIGYDVEKAKALMAEAGYPDGFEVTLLTYNISKATTPPVSSWPFRSRPGWPRSASPTTSPSCPGPSSSRRCTPIRWKATT